MDNMILYAIVALVIILIPATWFLVRMLRAQAERDGRAKRERLNYQPSAKPVWVPAPVPISKYAGRQQPAPAPVTGPDPALLDDCRDIQQSLVALVKKYSLDSFTMGTSDGLVFASSGGSTAQEDAAMYSRNHDIEESAGVASFSLNHRGSDLVGIIRTKGIISGDLQKHIESDTKDILNKWI